MPQIIQQLSADEFEKVIKKRDVILIDVRERYEFDKGRIRGAKLVPSTNFQDEFEKLGLKKSDKIAICCNTGNRSEFCAGKLKEMGYKNIYHLELGTIDWIEQGKKLVS